MMTEPSAVSDLAARASRFVARVEDFDSVERVETVTRDGQFYWKVVPAEPTITPDVATELGRHGVSATPDGEGLLVRANGIVFEGDGVDLIQNAVRQVQDLEDMDALEAASLGMKFAEVDDDLDDPAEALDKYREVTDLVRTLFVGDDPSDPLVDPDADIDWVVIPVPAGDGDD